MTKTFACRVAVFGCLVAWAAPALGQPEAYDSLLRRAPKLAISGAVTKLAAPLAIGGAGWGPFKRLCVSRMLIQPDGKEVPETEPGCFTVQQAREEGGTWQLEILTDAIRGGPPVAFATSRDAAGRVGEVAITPPEGVPVTPAALEGLQRVFRVMLAAHGMAPFSVTPGIGFLMPLDTLAADSDTTVEGGGFACMPDGTATLRGRAVLVATCRARARTKLGDEAISRIDMAGRFAIDLATGMVLQHGYASFLFMETDPKKFMPNLRWRGVSRQSLK